MKNQENPEAKRERLEREVCQCLKVLAGADRLKSGETGDFYTSDFTARGCHLRELPYRIIPDDDDVQGAASILAQIGFLTIDLCIATDRIGDETPFRGLDDAVRESAVALGRVLLSEPEESSEPQRSEPEGAPRDPRAELDERAARFLQVWAHANDLLPDSYFADLNGAAEDLFQLGHALKGERSSSDRGEYEDELYSARSRVPPSGPGIPSYKPRPESASRQRVVVPQMRHRAQVNAAAGVLIEAYDQANGLDALESLLDHPHGELGDCIAGVLKAMEELMIRLGRVLAQPGDAIQVGEHEEERWIVPEESLNGALVVVNGSQG